MSEAEMTDTAFDDLAKRVDDAVGALEDLDPAARKVAEELQGAVEAIHKAGLVTIVRRLRAEDATREALFELAADPAVHLLLSLHGIVRPDPVTHANQVLESVRPQLHSHGGDVALVRIEDGTAFVRLEGACNGCSMSSVTLRNLVEEALVQGVPAITAVEVVAAEPSPTLIPVESLRIGRDLGLKPLRQIHPAMFGEPLGTLALPVNPWVHQSYALQFGNFAAYRGALVKSPAAGAPFNLNSTVYYSPTELVEAFWRVYDAQPSDVLP